MTSAQKRQNGIDDLDVEPLVSEVSSAAVENRLNSASLIIRTTLALLAATANETCAKVIGRKDRVTGVTRKHTSPVT